MSRALPLAVLALVLLAGAPVARGKDSDPMLDYRRTWAGALLEARARGVPALVSRHKDG